MEPLVGYAVYLGALILPGIGIGEALSTWMDDDTLTERIAIAIGLGISFTTLVLAIMTSGISIAGTKLAGLGAGTIYLIFALGLFALLLSFAKRKRFAFPKKPGIDDLIVLSITLILSAVLYLYFQKYPIFPAYNSPDYQTHAEIANSLLSGSLLSIPNGLLYYGIHLQIALSFLIVDGLRLIIAQRVMAILVIISPLFFYLASKRIFENRNVAIITSVVYALSGSIWVGSVFNAGLYANFFGIIISLFLLSLIIPAMKNTGSIRAWMPLTIALPATYMSHYTTVVLLFTLLLIPFIQPMVKRSHFFNFFAPSALTVAPAILALIIRPDLPNLLINLATSGGGRVIGSTPISSSLESIPVLSFMAVEVNNDISFSIFIVLTIVSFYLLLKKMNVILFIPLIWFLSLLIASPFNISAWRFSFEALVPMTMLACFAISSIFPSSDPTKKRVKGRGSGRARALAITVFLVLPLIAGSWTQSILSDSLKDASISSNTQMQVYNAIQWLGLNTPERSKYLSASDWRFTYTSILIGRETYYNYVSEPNEAISLAKQIGASYIIITNIVTEDIPPIPSLFPWNNFPGNSSLALVYNSSDVRIYRII